LGENVIIYNILGFLDICNGCTVRFCPAGNCLHFVSLLSAILLDEKLDFAKIQLFVLLFGRKLLAEMLTRDLAFFECAKKQGAPIGAPRSNRKFVTRIRSSEP